MKTYRATSMAAIYQTGDGDAGHGRSSAAYRQLASVVTRRMRLARPAPTPSSVGGRRFGGFSGAPDGERGAHQHTVRLRCCVANCVAARWAHGRCADARTGVNMPSAFYADYHRRAAGARPPSRRGCRNSSGALPAKSRRRAMVDIGPRLHSFGFSAYLAAPTAGSAGLFDEERVIGLLDDPRRQITSTSNGTGGDRLAAALALIMAATYSVFTVLRLTVLAERFDSPRSPRRRFLSSPAGR